MINGKKVPRNLSQFCGFSPQVMCNEWDPFHANVLNFSNIITQADILNPGLTVREHLSFSLCLRRRDDLEKVERTAIINDVLASLRLRDCSERKVTQF